MVVIPFLAHPAKGHVILYPSLGVYHMSV